MRTLSCIPYLESLQQTDFKTTVSPHSVLANVHKLAEEGRNSVRQVRRDANERLKKLLKDHKISEDDEKKGLDEVQKITDNHIKQIDETQKKKDAELLGR